MFSGLLCAPLLFYSLQTTTPMPLANAILWLCPNASPSTQSCCANISSAVTKDHTDAESATLAPPPSQFKVSLPTTLLPVAVLKLLMLVVSDLTAVLSAEWKALPDVAEVPTMLGRLANSHRRLVCWRRTTSAPVTAEFNGYSVFTEMAQTCRWSTQVAVARHTCLRVAHVCANMSASCTQAAAQSRRTVVLGLITRTTPP
jgi:hypothetical protein